MNDTHLARLGAWVASLQLADVPVDVRRAARAEVLDMVAAAHAAGRSGNARPVLEAMEALHGSGRSTVLVSGRGTSPVAAAMANCACSMAEDFDSIVWMGHTCHSAVFAPLAVAEHEGATADAFELAVVVANEIGGRLGASSFLGPLNGQMWTFIHLIGAAAGAAKLLGLDAERTTHAMAIALAQPNFALQPGFFGPGSKILAAAVPTATGIEAAYMARAGLTGAPAIIEDRRGFWRRFSFHPMPGMLGDLGELWVLRTLTVKTFPVCHYFQTALEALERIHQRRPLALDQVASIRIETTKVACEVVRFAGEYAKEPTATGLAFDLRWASAALLCAGRLTTEELEPSFLAAQRDTLHAWAAKVEVVHDVALTAKIVAAARRLGAGRAALGSFGAGDLVRIRKRYQEEYASSLISPLELPGTAVRFVRAFREPMPPSEGTAIPLPFPARVIVRWSDGAEEREEIDLPEGSLATPAFTAALKKKYVHEVGRFAPDAAARFDRYLEEGARNLAEVLIAGGR